MRITNLLVVLLVFMLPSVARAADDKPTMKSIELKNDGLVTTVTYPESEKAGEAYWITFSVLNTTKNPIYTYRKRYQDATWEIELKDYLGESPELTKRGKILRKDDIASPPIIINPGRTWIIKTNLARIFDLTDSPHTLDMSFHNHFFTGSEEKPETNIHVKGDSIQIQIK